MWKVLRPERRREGRVTVEHKPAQGGSICPVPADTVFDRVELGELAHSGEPCPCSGWWEARLSEGTVPMRRFILRGQLVPNLTQAPLRGWRRLFAFPRRPTAGNWRLVQYDDAITIPSAAADEAFE